MYTLFTTLFMTLSNFRNCLFGAFSLTKNADVGKYKYIGYGIGFDRHGKFSFSNNVFRRNCTIFEADSNCVYYSNDIFNS